MKAANLKLSEINEGNVYSFTKEISEEDVNVFANLTGDLNPLHVDKEFGRKSQFGKNIVHGMLAASLFSTLVGMYCPGRNSLYLSQTLQFRTPLFFGDVVEVRATVIAKNESTHLITLKTEIIKEGYVCISGQAKVKIIGGENG